MPYVIEPAAGVDRAALAFLLDAYAVDEAPNTKGGVDKRTVLRLDPRLAPVKAAVLPLSRGSELSPIAKNVATELAQAVERRLRRRGCHRPALPAPGRDRHAVLGDRRLRLARTTRPSRFASAIRCSRSGSGSMRCAATLPSGSSLRAG